MNGIRRTILSLAIGALAGCALFSRSVEDIPSEYTVRGGDTIGAISGRFSVDPAEVMALNGIDDPRTLQIGAVLKIPLSHGSGAPLPSPLAREESPRGALSAAALKAALDGVGKLVWPVKNARLTSRFGYRWLHFHEGLDLGAPEGTPIYAAHDGVVVYSGTGIKGYGNTIAIKRGDLMTVYGHNLENSVAVGDAVSAGDEIGSVGATGRASGPHCHFETRIRDRRGKFVAVDPMAFYREEPPNDG